MSAAAAVRDRVKGTPPRLQGSNNAALLNQPRSGNQATVLPAKDWERLKLQLTGVDLRKEALKKRQDDREAKHDISTKMVKNWQNTIEGQRLKRLETLKIKEAKEEEERIKIDEEEAKFQAARRQEAIDRAKTLIYHQTDRIKGFHSALVLSDVLKERDAQIAFKKKRQSMYQNQDEVYRRYQDEVIEKGKLADMLAAQERRKEVASIASYQLKQMSEHAATKKKERELQLQEQAAIEKETQEWREKEKEKEQKRLEDKVFLSKELRQLIIDNKRAVACKKEQDKLSESERKLFSSAKRNMTKMRKAKESEILQEFQDHQNKMADYIYSMNKEKVSNEDERIAKAVAEQDAKREREEREKSEKFMKSILEIDQCCQEMIREQERKRREMKELEQEMLRQRIAQDQRFHTSHLQKQQKRFYEAKEVEKFHKAQMVEKSERERIERDEQDDYHCENLELLKVEESQFQQYADQVIKEAKSRNASLYPLQKASKKGSGGGHGPVYSAKGGVRPSYLPCASPIVELPSYASKDVPIAFRRRDTKKRMGFVW